MSRLNANQTKTFVWNWASTHRLYIDIAAQLAYIIRGRLPPISNIW